MCNDWGTVQCVSGCTNVCFFNGEKDFYNTFLWPSPSLSLQVAFIKTDFNRWRDESDSESDNELGDQDSNLQAMMQQMGGLGGSSGGNLPGMDVSWLLFSRFKKIKCCHPHNICTKFAKIILNHKMSLFPTFYIISLSLSLSFLDQDLSESDSDDEPVPVETETTPTP